MANKQRHDEIYMDLRGQVLDGRFAPGTSLPRFKELAASYGVSVATVNKAIARLKVDGLVRAVRGAGVFVADLEQAGRPRGIIGVVLPELRSSIYLDMVHGITERGEAARMMVQLCDSDYDCGRELEYLENLAANPQVKGIIVSPGAGKAANTAFFEWLKGIGYPFVFVDRYLPEIETDSVRSDSVAGARAAIEHLLARGHRRIAFVSAEDALDQPWCRDRLAGYEQALRAAGIAPDPRLVANSAGAEEIRRFLEQDEPPTAVFLASNRYLWRVLEGIEYASTRSDSQIIVAGFDEIEAPISKLSRSEIRRYTEASLIKVIQPFEQIGREGCELLVHSIDGTRGEHVTRVLAPELVVP